VDNQDFTFVGATKAKINIGIRSSWKKKIEEIEKEMFIPSLLTKISTKCEGLWVLLS